MSDTSILNNDHISDRVLTPAQRENRQSAELIPFGEHGTTPQNFAQVVDFAKMMAAAKSAVPAHLQGNIGGCLAVIEIAQKFQMSAYMLARGTYFVKDMMAFDGQTIMAIMNKHLPMAKTPEGHKTRLTYEFVGDILPVKDSGRTDRAGEPIFTNDSTLRVIVRGRLEHEADVLEYESPMIKDIKVKNSPLWNEDPKQQLIYFASRRWQRRWVPELMLGIYEPEELRDRSVGFDNAKVIDADPGKSLAARIEASRSQANADDEVVHVEREGFSTASVDAEVDAAHTTKAAPTAEQEIETAKQHVDETGTAVEHDTGTGEVVEADAGFPGDRPMPPADDGIPENLRRTKTDRKAKSEKPAAEEPAVESGPALPKTVGEWKTYALEWINASTDPEEMKKRWTAERKLRNDCGVTEDERDDIYDALLEKRDTLAAG